MTGDEAAKLRLEPDGAQRFCAAVRPADVRTIEAALPGRPAGQAGIRLFGVAALRPHLEAGGCVGTVAASVLGGACRPVRAILFDKTPATNWALGWHQDRVIAVAERVGVAGFGPWTRKQGALHVAPPFELLARMLTLRLHLDDVPATNAPLLVAPRSHRLGLISQSDVPSIVQRCDSVACTAVVGDVWLYATPILHASDAAAVAAGRRVLQVDYSADELPGGLRWLGV